MRRLSDLQGGSENNKSVHKGLRSKNVVLFHQIKQMCIFSNPFLDELSLILFFLDIQLLNLLKIMRMLKVLILFSENYRRCEATFISQLGVLHKWLHYIDHI